MPVDIKPGDRVRVEAVVTHVETNFVELCLETGGRLRIPRREALPLCRWCAGTGMICTDEGGTPCDFCSGTGRVNHPGRSL